MQSMTPKNPTNTRRPEAAEYAAVRPDLSWTNSYWIIALLAIFIGLLSTAGCVLVDWTVHRTLPRVFASDVLTGIIAAVVSGVALIRMQARRRELVIRMQIVEDVNHHVRNALTAIVLSSSLRQDSDLDAQVKDACDRVDWVLNNALVHTVGGKPPIEKQSRWSRGRRFERKR